jgi:excinuclease ABC subunit C
MDYYIGICPAPCLLTEQSVQEHNLSINSLKTFLRDGSGNIIQELSAKMQSHAQKLEFEAAQKTKELIGALSVLGEKQIVRDILPGDHDIFVWLEKYEKSYSCIIQIRNSMMV